MILHIIAALVAALLALTGSAAEEADLSSRGGVTETCDPADGFDADCNLANGTGTPPSSELPGPRLTG